MLSDKLFKLFIFCVTMWIFIIMISGCTMIPTYEVRPVSYCVQKANGYWCEGYDDRRYRDYPVDVCSPYDRVNNNCI